MPSESTLSGRMLNCHMTCQPAAAVIRRLVTWIWLCALLEQSTLAVMPSYRRGAGATFQHPAYLLNSVTTQHPFNRFGDTHAFVGGKYCSAPAIFTPSYGCMHGSTYDGGLSTGYVRARDRIPHSDAYHGGKFVLCASKSQPATSPALPVLDMTEEEHVVASSNLFNLFTRCVKACDSDDFEFAVETIVDYVKGYDKYCSPFFQEPVEVTTPVLPSDKSHEDPASSLDDANTDAEGEAVEHKKAASISDKSLSYHYTSEEVGIDVDGAQRRWRVSIKPNVSRTVRRLIMQHRKLCAGIIGRAMHKISTLDDLRAITSVSRDAARLGMVVLKGMYAAMCVIHAKLGRAEKAFKYLERMWALGDRRRHRSYEPLFEYFEEHLDGDGMLSVLRHMVEVGGMPMSGLVFTRVLVTIGLSAKRGLLDLGKSTPVEDSASSHRLSMAELPADDVTRKVSNEGAHATNASPRNGKRAALSEVYGTLRRQLTEALEIFHKHSCNRVSLSSRLGYVVSTVLSDVVPGLVHYTHVSPGGPFTPSTTKVSINSLRDDRGAVHTTSHSHDPDEGESHGVCAKCKHHVPLVQLSVEDRLTVFRSWLQNIYDYNFPEITRLANFYAWLHAPMREGMSYTCILDGQNIGYHRRQDLSPLDFYKIDTVLREMVRRGERPLVVLPHYARANSPAACDVLEPETIDLLFPGHKLPRKPITLSSASPSRPKRYSAAEIDMINRWTDAKQVYFCKVGSYDDNYFLLANVMTGCAEELAVLGGFLKSSLSLSLAQKDETDTSVSAADLPDPKVEDYVNAVDPALHRPMMITVTNDSLANLEIPGVEERLMRALRDIPLSPYFFIGDEAWRGNAHTGSSAGGYGGNAVVGQRLKYSLEMSSSGNGRYHIPLGYERKVIDYRARHTVWVTRNEKPRIDPPAAGLFLDTLGPSPKKGEQNMDPELVQVQAWLDKHGYTELLQRLGPRMPERNIRLRHPRGYGITTRTPEAMKQKFNPSQQTRWLCVDLSAIDNVATSTVES
ncbi:pentatricopeptide repeat containing protein, putative [Babesia ovata]|uniref:Pentatricopeptide repeat containing protein, putative n=1 Tax=Babesia ovata TaxID=189622 RepID=A0A2H6KAX4_9APIC|nr:pentatricopeptide repeat containing protein, putative [Babesia ovata]GBE60144.1 pentatricopeptide repeat containing protein, putative [Babesia ovata]